MASLDSHSPASSYELSPNELIDDDGPDDVTDAGAGKKKGKRPPSTAERRANHNAIERARRESLNGRFLELARALPTMAHVKRPSKSIIVAKSLEYVNSTQSRDRAIVNEMADLKREVDELRARLGLAPRTPTAALAPKVAASAGAEQQQQQPPTRNDGSAQHMLDHLQQQQAFFAAAAAASFPFNTHAVPAVTQQQQHSPRSPDAKLVVAVDGFAAAQEGGHRRFSHSSAGSTDGGDSSPPSTAAYLPASQQQQQADMSSSAYLASLAAFNFGMPAFPGQQQQQQQTQHFAMSQSAPSFFHQPQQQAWPDIMFASQPQVPLHLHHAPPAFEGIFA